MRHLNNAAKFVAKWCLVALFTPIMILFALCIVFGKQSRR